MLKGGLFTQNNLKKEVFCGGKTTSSYCDGGQRDLCGKTGTDPLWCYCAKEAWHYWVFHEMQFLCGKASLFLQCHSPPIAFNFTS